MRLLDLSWFLSNFFSDSGFLFIDSFTKNITWSAILACLSHFSLSLQRFCFFFEAFFIMEISLFMRNSYKLSSSIENPALHRNSER